MKRRMVAVLALVSLLMGLTACAEAPLARTQMMLDTVCTVTLYDAQSEEMLDNCMTLIASREALWSKTAAESEVAKLNAAGGQPIPVSADTLSLLQTAQFYADMTGGAFDVTVASFTTLWEAAEGSGTPPTAEALTQAAAAVDNTLLTVGADGTVTLSGGAQIDLGGIAKGQIADDLVTLLEAGGCTSALIDLGGNIVAHGTKPDGSAFHVGITDPRDTESLIATVAVSNCSVVTSGSYERGYQVGNTRYSHIIDPATGMPVQNDLLSVTILSPHAVDGDVLSTACFVMGYEKAAAFLEGYADIEAVFVMSDGRVVATDGVVLV